MASMGCMVDLVTGRTDAVVIAGPAMGYEDVAPTSCATPCCAPSPTPASWTR
jgi:hypothetical protein